MKALVAQELSGPSGLVYTDVPDPAPTPDSVLVDVRAAGVCFPDLLLIGGRYQLRVDPPFIPGTEVAGVVRSAPEGSGFRPGDRVFGPVLLGGYAEQAAIPLGAAMSTPPELDDAQAVSLLVNYITIYFALKRRAALRSGETVLVLGSAGGLGTAAIQVAKAMGARVVAVVHREKARDYVAGLGADVVLPMTDGWSKAVRENAGGRGADVVVDPVGGEPFDEAVRALAVEGRLLVLGFAAGAIPAVKVNRLLLRNAGVLGVGWREYLMANPNAQAEYGQGVGELVREGLRPPVPQRYPLSEGRAALEILAAGGLYGKLVLEP
ncbi:MAG: NADPH:quinone oxidoreductase family protein [Mycobacterium sp.]|nr:NADPH:quinone oxidoreductase family protein [Mycobacterium sp.]